MSGSARKHSSKWDKTDDPEFAPDSKQLRSYLEGNDKFKSGMGFSSKETYSGGRSSKKDHIMNKDYRDLDETMEWDADGSYKKKFSPGHEEWKYKRRSQSPKNSRTRSAVRSSRSRSPPHGFRRDSGFSDRNRTRAGGSTQPCREFAAGKCRRGSHCHFLHHDNQNYEDSWESRHREDGAPRYSGPHDSRDHSLMSGRSNETCVNYAKGRCRLGASCNFVHENNSDGYGKGSVDELTREREYDRRRRDSSFDQGGGHGPNRSGPMLCKFFANGNCRNGKYCRFSHDRQACGSPTRRSRDDRWGSDQGEDHQMLDRPKLNDSVSPNDRLRDDRWGSDVNMVDMGSPKQNDDRITVSATAKLVEDESVVTDWPKKDGWGHGLDEKKVRGERTFSRDKKESDYCMPENAGANMRISQSIGTGNWSGDEMSPDWNYRVGSSSLTQEEHGQNKHGIAQGGPYLATEHVVGTQVTPGQGVNQKAPNIIPLHSSSGHGVGQSHVPDPILPSRGVVESMHDQEVSADVLPGQGFNQNAQNINSFHSSSSHPVGQSQVAVLDLPSRGVVESMHNQQVSTDVLPGQGFNQHAQNINPLHCSSGHAVGQSQVAVPILPSRGVVDSMHNQESCAEKNYILEPNIADAGLSQVSSSNPPTRNMVSNEQLSNLSASLAHILGTGQQLPQLYAALNSHDAKDTPSLAKTEVSAMPVSNSFINSDPAVGFPKQYDPMFDSIEPRKVDTSGSAPAFSPTKKNAEDKAQIMSLPLPFTAACSEEHRVKSEHLIQPQPVQNLEVKEKTEVALEESQYSQDGHKNTKENGPSQNMDQNGGQHDAKKTKDAKGIRAFKFALVEFVKELLKPAWKEGQINKEDYKEIVKKAVDKVTGSMQGANIPQTQEKIDQYLSFSKPKLSKLVQAYVERVQKA